MFFLKSDSVYAVGTVCPTAPPAGLERARGLITARGITGKFNNQTGQCILDTQRAPYVNFKIPTYDNLKSIYFSQAKDALPAVQKVTLAVGNYDQTILNGYLNGPNNLIINIPGNLLLNGPITGSRTAVIFVDGTVSVSYDVDYNAPDKGLVFVSKGPANIYYLNNNTTNTGPMRVDATFMASGRICTALVGSVDTTNKILAGSCPTSAGRPVSKPLILNGSLISLDVNNNILLNRTLDDNFVAAETIDAQTKYLVILRDLFSQSLNISTEDTTYALGF